MRWTSCGLFRLHCLLFMQWLLASISHQILQRDPKAVKGFLRVKALYSRQRCFTEHSHTEELPSLAYILEIAVLAQVGPIKTEYVSEHSLSVKPYMKLEFEARRLSISYLKNWIYCRCQEFWNISKDFNWMSIIDLKISNAPSRSLFRFY